MIDTALLVSVKHGSRKEFLVKSEGELHTDKGIINLETLKELEYGDIILTHMGYEFRVLKPRNPDFFHHFKRTGAHNDASGYWRDSGAYRAEQR